MPKGAEVSDALGAGGVQAAAVVSHLTWVLVLNSVWSSVTATPITLKLLSG